MLLLGIQEIPGTGLDDDAQAELLQRLAEPLPIRRLGGERIAVVGVQSKRDTPVPTPRNDFQRLLQLVVGETVGIIAKAQIHRVVFR